MRSITVARIVALSIAVAGCAAPTPPVSTTDAALPAAFAARAAASAPTSASSSTSTSTPRDETWWRACGDPRLLALAERAATRAPAVAIADSTVRQARLGVELAEHALGPVPFANGSITHQRAFEGPPPRVVDRHSTTAGASWQRDLAPAVADGALERARQALDAARAARTEARWDVVSQVVDHYGRIAALDLQRPLLAATTRDAEATRAATRLRLEAGKARVAELEAASSALADARASEAQALRDRSAEEGAIAVLVGEVPEHFTLPAASLPADDPPDVAADAPARVLDRRPDVRAARIALDGAMLTERVARADLYPRVLLSGSLATTGTTLRQLLRDPLATFGLDVTLPFVDWPRVRGNADVAASQREAAAIAFRDALRRALLDVERQLQQRDALVEQLASAREHLRLAVRESAVQRLRHETGAAPAQAVRDAEQAGRAARAALADLRARAWSQSLALHRALGDPAIAEPTAGDADGR